MLDKIWHVKKLYRHVNGDIAAYRLKTGLHCPAGCGECCHKEGVEATVLEFLPLAYHVCRQGQGEYWQEKAVRSDKAVCILKHESLQVTEPGWCSMYDYRALICRLFGFSSLRDKYDHPRFATCRIIRNSQVELVSKAEAEAIQGRPGPVMESYSLQLCTIDHSLGNRYYPINEAISKAIDMVSLHLYFKGLAHCS